MVDQKQFLIEEILGQWENFKKHGDEDQKTNWDIKDWRIAVDKEAAKMNLAICNNSSKHEIRETVIQTIVILLELLSRLDTRHNHNHSSHQASTSTEATPQSHEQK